MITAKLIRRITTNLIDIDLVKQHLVVEHADDDQIIQLYIDTAIQHIEDVTRRTLPLSRYRMRMDEFEDVISLRNPPIRAITGLSYYDTEGVQQIISPSDMHVNLDYEWLKLSSRTRWPKGTRLELMVVAGYGAYVEEPIGLPYSLPLVLGGTASDVVELPRPLMLAALMLVAHWYENREPVSIALNPYAIPHGVNALLFKYRNYRI